MVLLCCRSLVVCTEELKGKHRASLTQVKRNILISLLLQKKTSNSSVLCLSQNALLRILRGAAQEWGRSGDWSLWGTGLFCLVEHSVVI